MKMNEEICAERRFFLFGERNMGKSFPIFQNSRLIDRGVRTTDL